MGLPSFTKVINDSVAELCDCLSEAQSEEEAQACAPDKSMEDLEAIYNDCLNDWEEMENAIEEMEEALEEMPDMEEYEEWPEEEGDKSACDCLKEVMDSEEHVDRAPAGCEWMDNLDDNQLMEELKDCPEMAAMFVVIPEMEEALEEEGDYILSLEEELEALNEERRELIIHIRAYELDISEIEYELKSYDTIPNFEKELCRCYIDEGYTAPEPPCDYPEMSEDEWEKFGRDCDRFDFLLQEISWMNDYLDEDLHSLDLLDMERNELEIEIQMEKEIDELLEAEHNPQGSDYDFNPGLAFKAQDIFSALESEDFDLFLDLV